MPLFGAPEKDLEKNTQTPQIEPIKSAVTPSVKNQPATIIAGGVRLEGEFKSQGDVQIEGEVIGTVETNATLTIGKDAKVKAGVKASNASVAGEVNGNITVENRLELKNTAKIKGDIICGNIIIESGAAMEGNLKCGVNILKGDISKPAESKDKIVTAPDPAVEQAKLN